MENSDTLMPQLEESSPQPGAPTVGTADLAVFWDFENVRIPNWCPATAASECIRNKLSKYGRIIEKRLYYDSRQPTERSAPRSDLDLSGFTLVDCPSRGRKETLDKKLIVDVLCFAWERASMGAKACVVLITSDGDYSYALARLRDIGVFTIIICNPKNAADVLFDNANVVYSWEFDVLGGPPTSQDDEDSREEEDVYGDHSIVLLPNKHSSIECSDPNGDGDSPARTNTNTYASQFAGVKAKLALFRTLLLNSSHRKSAKQDNNNANFNWVQDGEAAAIFYEKIGKKDREAYHEIRSLAFTKGFIEWGRRNLLVHGKPIIKVIDRDVKAGNCCPGLYVRLTSAGVLVAKSNDTKRPFSTANIPLRVPSVPACLPRQVLFLTCFPLCFPLGAIRSVLMRARVISS